MINGISPGPASPTLSGKRVARKCTGAFSISFKALTFLPIVFALSFSASAATKVAFIADTGSGGDHRQVMNLISDEGADLVLIQGDFGYSDNRAARWEENLTTIMGRNFPILSVIGNHEDFEWPLYQRYIKQRVERAAGLSCSGNVGVKANCTFANLRIVQVAPGITEVPGIAPKDGYDTFIKSSFKNNDGRWNICAWHKNQRAMQAYTKTDETGWDVYNACLDVGAIVSTGHAHTYSRTHLLSDFENQSVVHRRSDMTIQPGQSIAVVSGLGGRDQRPQRNNGDWFASVYTSTQGATHGALFCTFERDTADCYFKAVNGAIPDQFTLRRGSAPIMDRPSGPSRGAGVFSRNDKTENWWLAQNGAGQWTRRWISKSCADSLGGATYTGNWDGLNNLATVAGNVDPCAVSNDAASSEPSDTGYVFYRPDVREYRWIDRNSSGQVGSIWIDGICASRMGGIKYSGSWSELMRRAPAFDSIKNPCTSGTNVARGYVFSRTDINEFRWIDTNASGSMGSIWISKSCADKLGGVKKRGDWFQLLREAPGFDTIANPCS